MKFNPSYLLPSLLLLACQTTSSPVVVEADPAQRKALLDTVSALAGRWEAPGEDGTTSVVEFAVSSNGSAVRELLFPGTEHEMTNMYTLDGNSLVMTHYCAGGNQPRMRATAIEGNTIAFESEGVSDLKSTDEVYMGAMTLVIVDGERIEEHWSALKDGQVDHEQVFELKRVR